MVCTKTKLLFALHIVLSSSITCSQSVNTLSANQTIKHGETIVSPKENYELGFFSNRNSTSYYVGIWYKKILKRTVVWVANRNTPLIDNSSELTLTVHGVLMLRDTTGKEVWSSARSSTRSVRNPLGQLLDTGNFIISDEADTKQENPIWQSFDHMTDTLLPGMKHGWNLVTGIQTYLTSWKFSDDPAAGEFTSWLDKKGYPQWIVADGQGITIFRQGPWDGLGFTGVPDTRQNPIFSYEFVLNEKEIYFRYNLINDLFYIRMELTLSGNMELLLWIDNTQDWEIYWVLRKDRCDEYNLCGPFGSCNINNNDVCDCLNGFQPTSPEQYGRVGDWSQGCRPTTPLNCGPGELFKKYSNLKLPDTQGSWYNQSMNLQECEKMCKSNCSCTAYTNSNFSGTGSGCLLWFGDLVDIRTFDENGDSLYIRLSPSELESTENNKSSNAGRGKNKYEYELLSL